jgi:hypothetical protein
MNYDNLDVEKIVDEVVKAEVEGRTRPATKKESMSVRLAALGAMVHQMQEIVENEKELVNA